MPLLVKLLFTFAIISVIVFSVIILGLASNGNPAMERHTLIYLFILSFVGGVATHFTWT